MADISQDIQVDLVIPALAASNRKQALQALAAEIAPRIKFPANDLLNLLMERENASSSGIGEGVAIPHLKLTQAPYRFAALALLEEPVDFGAADQKPVDMICVLTSPDHEGPLHLRRLARMSRLLQARELRALIRSKAPDENAIKSLLAEQGEWMMAA